MEAKNLVLLLLMPFILSSLIFYISNNQTVTGAVIAEKEDNKVLGTYSLMPSFNVKIDYDLKNEYEILNEKLNSIIEDCKNAQDIEQCLEDKSNDFNWNCKGSADNIAGILYDFTDKLKECMTLEEDGIVCRLSLDERKITTQQKNYEILLIAENNELRAELKEGTKVLATEYLGQGNLLYTGYNNKDETGKNANFIRIMLEYYNKKIMVKEAYAIDKSTRIDLSKIFLIYKKSNQIKFVELTEENNFRAPVPANKIVDLPITRGFRFCAKTGKQVYAHDYSDNTTQLRDIIYKFAVTYPASKSPPPVKYLVAEDKLKAEKSVVLKWNKAKWDDGTEFLQFDHYNVYCSENPLQDNDSKEIKLGLLNPTMSVKSPADTNYDFWHVDLDKCSGKDIEDGKNYYFAVTAVGTSKKESIAIVQSSSKSIDDLAPGTQRLVLLNSDGKKENKVSNACIELPTAKSGVLGNIWVGFFAPEKNEDEITQITSDEQLDYYLHFAKQSPTLKNLDDCSNARECVMLSYITENDVTNARELESRTFNNKREIENPDNSYLFKDGETYCFTVVAKDRSNNAIKTLAVPYKFNKPRQWIDLENNPVQKEFFDYAET